MAVFLQMRERLHAEHPLDPASMPPEAAALHAVLQAKLRDAEQRAQKLFSKSPLGPEIQRLLRKVSESDEGIDGPDV